MGAADDGGPDPSSGVTKVCNSPGGVTGEVVTGADGAGAVKADPVGTGGFASGSVVDGTVVAAPDDGAGLTVGVAAALDGGVGVV